MVTDAQRAEIARVPQEVLNRIIRLPEPSFDSVSAELPEEHRHLAEPILSLLVRADATEATEPEEPVHDDEVMDIVDVEVEEEPEAPVMEETVPEPAPAPAPDASSSMSATAAFFGTEDFSTLRRRIDPAKILEVPSHAFAPFQYRVDEANAGGITVEHLELEGEGPRTAISWDPHPTAGQCFYRVVATSHIDQTPTPEVEEQLVITLDNYWEDEIPEGLAYREYQVWAYAAPTPAETLRAQPVLLGRQLVIFPVTGVTVSVADGTLSGTWDHLPGRNAVRVFVSEEDAPGGATDPGNQLHADVDERSFRHKSPRRNVNLRVALVPEIRRPDGSIATGPTREETVYVDGKLEKTNLEYAFKEDDAEGTVIRFGVMGPPAGTFRIYLTPTMPSKDLSWQEVPEEALVQEGLDGPDTLRHDYGELGHGAQHDKDELWPQGWDEVYITPVTLLDGKAWVGDSIALQRVQRIEEADLREYVGFQLVSFAWPRGASLVKIERRPLGGGDERTRISDVNETQYRQNGGVRLNLDPGGEDVILTPQSLYRGDITTAEETVLSYPGLWRYLYSFYGLPPSASAPGGLGLQIWRSDREDINPPRFTVMFHPERMPLFSKDIQDGGRALAAAPGEPAPNPASGTIVMPRRLGPGRQDTEKWFIPAEQLTEPGFIRVMMLPGDDDVVGGPVKILTDEANQFYYLNQDAIDQLHAPAVDAPAQAPPTPQPEPQPKPRRRGLFGFGG